MDFHFQLPRQGHIVTSEKRKRRTQAERSSETQERVTVAAIEVLRRKGYAGFRVTDVTEEAGVSRGAQSHHFPSKMDLVLAVFLRVFDQATEASRSRISNVKPDDDVVAAIVADASDFFLGKDFSMGLDMLGAAGRDPEMRDAVQEVARLNRFQVEDMWIGLLMSRGLSRDDAEDVLWLAFSTIRGLSVRMLWQFDHDRFERVKRITYEAARHLYESRMACPSVNEMPGHPPGKKAQARRKVG